MDISTAITCVINEHNIRIVSYNIKDDSIMRLIERVSWLNTKSQAFENLYDKSASAKYK